MVRLWEPGAIQSRKRQLLNLIPTIRATNTNSKQESLKVLADFGSSSWFYLRDLFENLADAIPAI